MGRPKGSVKKYKKQDTAQIRLIEEDEIKLLNEVRTMLTDKEFNIPSYREVTVACLTFMKNHLYQENGADVNPNTKRVLQKESAYTSF